jgi:hypothetical protein
MTTILAPIKPNFSTVNERELNYYLPVEDNFNSYPDAFYLLSHMGELSVTGPDATHFLQGQLTIDVNNIEDGDIGLYCNKEGRIIALIHIMRQEDGFSLLMPKDIIPTCLKKLKRYAMFSKVKLQQTENVPLFIQKENKQTPLLLTEKKAHLMCETLKKDNVMLGSLAWHHHQLSQHIPSIYPNTLEKFLPHKIGLHLKGAINFEKGCYLGQEIIARMHFKAKLKQSMLLLTLKQPKAIGETLYLEEKAVGEIIDTSPSKDNTILALASVKTVFEKEINENPDLMR